MKKEIDNVNRRKFSEFLLKPQSGFLMNKLPARSKRLFLIEGEIKLHLLAVVAEESSISGLRGRSYVRLVVKDVFEDRITECLKS